VPGFLLHVGDTVMCSHGGKVTLTPMPRVKVGGQPVVLQPTPYPIAGCPFTTPVGAPLPCVTAAFSTGSIRVKVNGTPILLQDSQATCAPNGVPATIVPVPGRVKGI
jgi:uncharacterized Zn-binding protein involved in type VI secretion